MAGSSVRLLVVGAGSRGSAYADYVRRHPSEGRVVAPPSRARSAGRGSRTSTMSRPRAATPIGDALDGSPDAGAAVIATPDSAGGLAQPDAPPPLLLLARTLALLLMTARRAYGNGVVAAAPHAREAMDDGGSRRQAIERPAKSTPAPLGLPRLPSF